MEEVAEEPPAGDGDGGGGDDGGGVEPGVEAREACAPVACNEQRGYDREAGDEQGVVAECCGEMGVEQGVQGAL